jgi:hypothetical protein
MAEPERTRSPAYLALRASARRVLRLVEAEIARQGSGVATIYTDQFELCGSRRVYRPALAEIHALVGYLIAGAKCARSGMRWSLPPWRASTATMMLEHCRVMLNKLAPPPLPDVLASSAPALSRLARVVLVARLTADNVDGMQRAGAGRLRADIGDQFGAQDDKVQAAWVVVVTVLGRATTFEDGRP